MMCFSWESLCFQKLRLVESIKNKEGYNFPWFEVIGDIFIHLKFFSFILWC